MTFRISHPPTYLAERRYIHDLLMGEFLGLGCVSRPHDRPEVRIDVPGHPDGKALVLPDVLFQVPESRWLTEAAMPRRPLARWDVPAELAGAPLVSRRLPVVFGRDSGRPCLYQESEEGATLGVDIFGSAFFLRTRYEELASPVADRHGRFPARASLAWQEGCLQRPLVNEYLEVLWAALCRLWPGLRRQPRSHRVLLSHDVDQPLCAVGRGLMDVLRSAGADLALRRDLSLVPRRLRAYLEGRTGVFDTDPANTFDFVMSTSESQGLQSAFYFMAGHPPGRMDGRYSLHHPWIRKLLRRIGQRGHEIGLHGGYDSPRDPLRLRLEFDNLRRVAAEEGIRQAVWGGRQHYLRWHNPATWQSWEAAGLDYDSTLAYADQPGFRCGVCYEYPVFDLKTRRSLRLRERPLVVMEAALIDRPVPRWADVCDRIERLNRTCKLFRGDFTLLWHNSLLISRAERHWYSVIARSL